jgi:anti-sigma B factor antagonist
MTDDLLQVRSERIDDRVTVLTVTGELDRDSADVLGTAAEDAVEEGASRLVLALGALTFCDSSGLRLLVELHKRTADRGGSLHLADVRPPVATVLHVVNLHRMLAVHPTVEDAIG